MTQNPSIRKLSCRIQGSTSSYEIEIQHGLLRDPVLLASRLKGLASQYAIVTHDTLSTLYGSDLRDLLVQLGLRTHLFSFPGGEKNKTRATKEFLENQFFDKGLGRDTCVIALGGGVVTDLAGFLAATYCRGIPFVAMPTSLLGMVDASIGGKTGVNVPHGKNMLGCIHQPKRVLIDPSTLSNLPLRELKNGIVEMIKHGLILDHHYFDYLERHTDRILSLEPHTLEKAIFESCRIKNEIVEYDTRENGKRRLLNFGHTIGHALETLSDYSLPHGEAVAIGILVESFISVQLGRLNKDSLERIQNMMEKFGIRPRLPQVFDVQTVSDAMCVDKKSLKGRPRFIIIDDIGSSVAYESTYCTHVEENLVEDALKWMNAVYFKLGFHKIFTCQT